MPEFRLRIWTEQILFDSHDYVVTAESLEGAVSRLQDIQEAVDFESRDRSIEGIDSVEDGFLNGVTPLDPSDIVGGYGGVCLIDEQSDRVRDLIGVPTGCDRLGEPLTPVDPVETMQPTLFILHISHKAGDSTWVFDDEEKAQAFLANWARPWWNRDGPRDPLTNLPLDMPEDDGEVVEAYFDSKRSCMDEYWSIEPATLNAG